MAVTLHVHTTHQQCTGGREAVTVEGDTVGACLKHLIRQFPEMEEAMFDGKGKLLNFVEVLVNHASVYPHELATPVRDGDEIHLLIMLSGG